MAKVWVAIAKQTTTEKFFENIFKNLLTNSPNYDIIRAAQPRWLIKLATKPCRVRKEVKVQ